MEEPLLSPENENNIPLITGIRQFVEEFKNESKKLWSLAGPAIFTSVCQFALSVTTQAFAGHIISTLDIAAFSILNTVIGGLTFGIMLGMGSALQTLCGQAYGAGKIEMLGLYVQRSWIILLITAFFLMFLYIFALPFLLLIGQTESISRASGKYALYMIPLLYAKAFIIPTTMFLQSQSKIMVMAWISAFTLVLHVIFSWLVMFKLGWGLTGGIVVFNTSWWIIAMAQLVYIFSGPFGKAWSGFSWKALQNLGNFARLSLESALMMCLEVWYGCTMVLIAGYMKNAEVAVYAMSICMSIIGVTIHIAVGFNAAISVRVSNELGASNPRKARFSVMVMVIFCLLIGIIFASSLLVFKNKYPSLFTDSYEVKEVVYQLTPLLAFCIIFINVQPAFSGVAIGVGFQGLVAYVNIGSYYLFGIPLVLVLAYTLNMGVKGILYGKVAGVIVQTSILFFIVCKINWKKEASAAAQRIEEWGGESRTTPDDVEK